MADYNKRVYARNRLGLISRFIKQANIYSASSSRDESSVETTGDEETVDNAAASPSDNDSSAESGASSGSLPDACTLLTTDEVNTAVNAQTTAKGLIDEDEQFSDCTWSDDTNSTFFIISIWEKGTAGDEWSKLFLDAQASAGEPEVVSDLGDEAYVKTDADLIGVYWRKGSEYVIVLTAAGVEPEAKDEIIELGRKIDSGF